MCCEEERCSGTLAWKDGGTGREVMMKDRGGKRGRVEK